MRDQSLFPVAAATLTAFACAVAVVIMPDIATAGDNAPSRTKRNEPMVRPPVHRPQGPYRELTTRDFAQSQTIAPLQSVPGGVVPSQSPRATADASTAKRLSLDETDQFAALESVQFALSEVGDGASYVWHRHNGRISGVVQPQSSFKTATGEVCRVIQVTLASGTRSKTAEGVACRLPSGQWRLEG